MNLIEELTVLGACYEAVSWARSQPDREACYRNCKRADWLLWWHSRKLERKSLEARRSIVGATVECAELVLPIFEARFFGDDQPRRSLELCKRFAVEGEFLGRELRDAYFDLGDKASEDYRVGLDVDYALDSVRTTIAVTFRAAGDAVESNDFLTEPPEAAVYAIRSGIFAGNADFHEVSATCVDIIRKWLPSPPEIVGTYYV